MLWLVKRTGSRLDWWEQQEQRRWGPCTLVSCLHGLEAGCDGNSRSCKSSSSPTPGPCMQGTCCCSLSWEPRLSSALLGRVVPSLTVRMQPPTRSTNCSVLWPTEKQSLNPPLFPFTAGPPGVLQGEACGFDPTAQPLCQTHLPTGLVTTCRDPEQDGQGKEDHFAA